MADEPTATKRVELIDQEAEAASGMPGYIGVGLIGGFVLGFGPLRDAVTGSGPFEDAMVRFVACLLVTVTAASFIGRIFDSAPPAEDVNETPSSGDGPVATPAPEADPD